jgi:hypothetical protein
MGIISLTKAFEFLENDTQSANEYEYDEYESQSSH